MSPGELEKEKGEEFPSGPGYDKGLPNVIEDEQLQRDGRLMQEAISRGISFFHPDIMMQKLVSNYRMAKKLYGETLLKALTNYDPKYIEKNKHIPEFQHELKTKLRERLKHLRMDGLLSKDNQISEKGFDVATISLYIEEIEHLPVATGGELVQKKRDPHGVKEDTIPFKRGFRLRDINIHQSVRNVIKRGHKKIHLDDVRVYNRKQVGSVEILYCIDVSSSMRGDKLKEAKKAGIALSYHAIQKKDNVGVMGFSSQVQQKVAPSRDFRAIIKDITMLTPGGQTNISQALREAIPLFSAGHGTKHVVLISDALPTFGDEPVEDAIAAVREVHDAGITISLIAIDLDEEGEQVANILTAEGGGKLYAMKHNERMDHIILEDYYNMIAR